MEIVCRSRGIASADFPRQGLIDIAKAGFSAVMMDISSYVEEAALEMFGREGRALKTSKLLQDVSAFETVVRPFFDISDREGLRVTAAYAPYLARDTKRTDLNELLETLATESIRMCGRRGCRFLVVRPVFSGIARESEWAENREYYLRLAAVAKNNGVQLLLENQGRNVSGHVVRGICADELEAVRWVEDLNAACGEERFGFSLNLGVAGLCGQNLYDFIQTLGSHLKMVNVCDTNGMEEASLLPFTGGGKGGSKTDWLNLIRGLRAGKFDCRLGLDMASTAASLSPLLRPALLSFARVTMEYLRWQVEIENLLGRYPSRVLFGAGNMCRAYMKCYGDQYPPLFTCDNNRDVWGTVFAGLEVKSPESLRGLPKNTAIFICNSYYRDIERQLREMDIENPIEYFNDEYLASFHFDRVEDLAPGKEGR